MSSQEPCVEYASIGSESWKGADKYEDSEIRDNVNKFFNTVKWDLLASIALKHRGASGCSYTGKFSIGQFNMVRRLKFDDGVSWIVRVRLPPEASGAPLEEYNSPRAFEVEAASMKFLKSRSTIPVPELFAYDSDPSNEAGVPYMFIEYIHGTTAQTLCQIKGSTYPLYGTISQDRKFREQMAKINAELHTFKFPQIGSLYWSKETDDFFIGPDVDMGIGPWNSSVDYYRDFTNVALRKAATTRNERPYHTLPVLLSHIMDIYSEEHNGPFRLINRDFGAHNILVDDDFNIVGVLDFDGVGSAPIEAAAQFPELSRMQVVPEGHWESHAIALEWTKKQRPGVDHYRQCLMRAEAELENDGSAPVASRLDSPAAHVYQAMTRTISMMQDCEDWLKTITRMLRKYYAEAPDSNIPDKV